MPVASVNGSTFEYAEQGQGEPLVLVHGSASDYRTWQVQLDVFGRRFRTIAYSRRYHWPNPTIPEDADYSMDEHVRDLEALLQSVANTPVHLVGHSYGAFLCLLLAIRAPRLVRSLVLTEPPVITLFVSSVPKPAEMLRLLLTRPRTGIALLRFGATGIGPATAAAKRGDMDTAMRVFGKAVLGKTFYERVAPARLKQIRANAFKAEFVGSGFLPLEDESLRRLDLPVLLVEGEDSPRLFHRLNDRLEELLPQVERVRIPKASHIVHEDDPLGFGDRVETFLLRNIGV